MYSFIEYVSNRIAYDEMVTLVKTTLGRFLKELLSNKQVTNTEIVHMGKGDNWCTVDIGANIENLIETLRHKYKQFICMVLDLSILVSSNTF